MDQQQMLERANYALIEEGRRQAGWPEPRFAAVRSSAKRWQKVGGVGAGWDARWRSSRCSWCAPPAAPGSGAAVRLSWAGCNKYAPQKTAGLPATELQKVPTHNIFNFHLSLS